MVLVSSRLRIADGSDTVLATTVDAVLLKTVVAVIVEVVVAVDVATVEASLTAVRTSRKRLVEGSRFISAGLSCDADEEAGGGGGGGGGGGFASVVDVAD